MGHGNGTDTLSTHASLIRFFINDWFWNGKGYLCEKVEKTGGGFWNEKR